MGNGLAQPPPIFVFSVVLLVVVIASGVGDFGEEGADFVVCRVMYAHGLQPDLVSFSPDTPNGRIRRWLVARGADFCDGMAKKARGVLFAV